jgi:hypothetical protein
MTVGHSKQDAPTSVRYRVWFRKVAHRYAIIWLASWKQRSPENQNRADEGSTILISTMLLSTEIVTELSCGDARPFANWPDPAVPTFGAGVYTIWHKDGRLIYVGMSGRGITAGTIQRKAPQGMYTRLHSHASGRRSGDQFCVYGSDRLVLPTLSQSDIAAISSGEHQMDAFVRRYIHQNLRCRFLIVPDGGTGYRFEATIKCGSWDHGAPLLNPARKR